VRVLRIVLSASVLSVAIFLPAAAVADAGDVGFEGPSYAGAGADPTGEKPESKLWFNDGSWWGSLWDTASGRYEIHRLNTSTQTWTSTNVPLDTRSNTRADTLWDGSKLYVASHVFGSPSSGYAANLWRFSYNGSTDTYTLDAGWPQQVNNVRSESLVIDKDSTGQLWATWVQGSSGNRTVWLNRTMSGDSSWGTPFELPVANTAVDNDDISALVAFGGNKIGVFWSNQKGASFHFAVHDDSAADTTWGSSVGVYPGAGNADDHINLKSLQTDGSGRVFAVVKTSKSNSTDPSVVLLVRSNSAVWTPYTIWTRGNNLTRPIVLLDTSNNRAHAFAAKESGGPVYTKTSSLSSIGFASGLGTEVMKDASHNDINNPTSTKQNVSSATGLVVLASNDSTNRYWHHFDALGGSGGGGGETAPVANFTASPTSGSAPLTVQFSDTSSGSPTSWAWDFDNNGSTDSTAQHPSYTYAAAGNYTVRLTATNAVGSDGETKTNYISVSEPSSGGGGGAAVTVTPVADTHVRADKPTSSFGSATTVWTRSGSSQTNAYLRFTVSGVGSAGSATLRLYVSDESPDAGKLYRVADNTWSENMLYADQPALGTLITDLGAVAAGAYVEVDVSAYVTGDGTYSFGIIGESSNQARFHSSEGTNHPQLVVTPSG
jgi:PKD repeat protein